MVKASILHECAARHVDREELELVPRSIGSEDRVRYSYCRCSELTIYRRRANPITFPVSLEIVHSFWYSRTSRRLLSDRVASTFFNRRSTGERPRGTRDQRDTFQYNALSGLCWGVMRDERSIERMVPARRK